MLNREVDFPLGAARAKKPQRLPTVLTREEVTRLLGFMSGVTQLIAKLLYRGGLRLSEAMELRAKDIDFSQRIITVRDAKGMKDRVTVLYTHVLNRGGISVRSLLD